ncbi:MAG TPA: peptidoglycan-binding domain-containing protein [Gammaproteobacteria bacterium]
MGEPYVLGARAPMANPSWRGPWDCAEFASWCVYQASGILFGTEPRDDPVRADAYTGYWAQQAAGPAVVSVDVAARIPGACVLRVPGSSRIGHIVISDGEGGTVEAHSTARGVVRHTLDGRRWDFGILVPGIEYHLGEEPIAVRAPGIVLRVTTPLMRGPRIRAIQSTLHEQGYRVGRIDGIYGPQTADAVQAFQLDNGLVADGEVGPATAALLGVDLGRQ